MFDETSGELQVSTEGEGPMTTDLERIDEAELPDDSDPTVGDSGHGN